VARATLDDIKAVLEEIRDQTGAGRGGGGAAGGAGGAGVPPEQRLATEQAIIDALEQQREILRESATSAQQKIDAEKRIAELMDRQNKLREDHKEAEEEVGEVIGANLAMVRDMGEEIGGIGQEMDDIVAKGKKGGGFANFLAGGLEKLGNLAGQLGMNFLKTVDEMQKLRGEFRRTTGASAQLGTVMSSTYDSFKGYGVSLEEAQGSTKTLMEGMSDFTMLSGKQQKALAGTSAVLGELGVSNEDFATSVQNATKGLGVSVDDADDMMRNLKATSIDLGIPTAELTRNFAQMSGQLAKLGDNGVKAFKDLARTSKITGIEMNRLLQITDKFDTFEGAASSAGQLNAALGGNFVNAMELMEETDPAKRFEMIRSAIQDAGLEFTDMGYYQKKFIAEAAGMQDAGELAKALSGDMGSLSDKQGKTSDSMESMAAAARDLRSVTERLALQLKAAEPSVTEFDAKTRDAQEAALGWTAKISKFFAELWKGNEVLVIVLSQVVGFITQFKLWGHVGTGVKKMFSGLIKTGKFLGKNVFTMLYKSVVRIPQLFGNMHKSADKLATTLGTKVGGKLGVFVKKIPLIGGVVSGLMNAWDQLVLSFEAFSQGNIAEGIGNIFGAVFKFADGFLSAVPGFFVWIGQLFGWVDEDVDANSLISSLLGPIFDGLMGSWLAFIENFEGFGSDFANILKEIPGFLWDMFKDLVMIVPTLIDSVLAAFGFDTFAKDLYTGLFESFESGFNKAIAFVKNLLGIASDSKVFAEIGGFMVDGLLAPFRNFGKLLNELIAAGMDMLPAPMKAAVKFLTDNAGKSVFSAGASLAGAAVNRAGAGTEALSGLVQDIQDSKDPYVLNLAMNMDGKEIGNKVVNVIGGMANEALNGE